jgi:hypothetical protein
MNTDAIIRNQIDESNARIKVTNQYKSDIAQSGLTSVDFPKEISVLSLVELLLQNQVAIMEKQLRG